MKNIITAVKDVIKGKPLSLRSPKWDEVRDKFLKDHNSCAACGATTFLQVHHIEPFHLFPEKELDPTNFITLCEHKDGLECHLKIGHLGNWKTNNANVVQDSKLKLESITKAKTLV